VTLLQDSHLMLKRIHQTQVLLTPMSKLVISDPPTIQDQPHHPQEIAQEDLLLPVLVSAHLTLLLSKHASQFANKNAAQLKPSSNELILSNNEI